MQRERERETANRKQATGEANVVSCGQRWATKQLGSREAASSPQIGQLRSAPKLRARAGAAETMVGIFSRFSAGDHRRAKSAAEVVETLAPNMNTVESDPAAVPAESPHGIEVGVEFKPVEHPVEPLNLDQPVKCPLPEPSILHDERIWKETMSSVSARVRTDLPVVKEGSQLEPDSTSTTRSRSAVPRRAILPSVSAPEHNILALLDECDVHESQSPAE